MQTAQLNSAWKLSLTNIYQYNLSLTNSPRHSECNQQGHIPVFDSAALP